VVTHWIQRLVLRPFLYSFLYTAFIPECGIFQICRWCGVSALKVFFDMVELTITAGKSEAMVFSRKHHNPNVRLWEKLASDQRVQISLLLLWFWATLEYTNVERAKTMLAKIEFHEIDSWNLVRGTSKMYAAIFQKMGEINSRLCVCILLWDD
jgi:hypothetical protein